MPEDSEPSGMLNLNTGSEVSLFSLTHSLTPREFIVDVKNKRIEQHTKHPVNKSCRTCSVKSIDIWILNYGKLWRKKNQTKKQVHQRLHQSADVCEEAVSFQHSAGHIIMWRPREGSLGECFRRLLFLFAFCQSLSLMWHVSATTDPGPCWTEWKHGGNHSMQILLDIFKDIES